MRRENLTTEGVSKYPAQFAFVIVFAVLGGLKLYQDLAGLSNGTVAVADVATDYSTTIVATVAIFVAMKMKPRRQSAKS